MNKTIEVTTEAGPVVVRKLALNDYAELLRALKKLPQEFGKFIEGNDAEQLKQTDTLYTAIPDIIATAIPEFCAVLATVTDKDAEFIGQLDLADAIDILVAALQLNDYGRIIASVKKIMALKPQPVEAEVVNEPKS